jgi:hypothetical protein
LTLSATKTSAFQPLLQPVDQLPEIWRKSNLIKSNLASSLVLPSFITSSARNIAPFSLLQWLPANSQFDIIGLAIFIGTPRNYSINRHDPSRVAVARSVYLKTTANVMLRLDVIETAFFPAFSTLTTAPILVTALNARYHSWDAETSMHVASSVEDSSILVWGKPLSTAYLTSLAQPSNHTDSNSNLAQAIHQHAWSLASEPYWFPHLKETTPLGVGSPTKARLRALVPTLTPAKSHSVNLSLVPSNATPRVASLSARSIKVDTTNIQLSSPDRPAFASATSIKSTVFASLYFQLNLWAQRRCCQFNMELIRSRQAELICLKKTERHHAVSLDNDDDCWIKVCVVFFYFAPVIINAAVSRTPFFLLSFFRPRSAHAIILVLSPFNWSNVHLYSWTIPFILNYTLSDSN